MSKAVRSVWRRHYGTQLSFPGQDEKKVHDWEAPACSATESPSSSSSSPEASIKHSRQLRKALKRGLAAPNQEIRNIRSSTLPAQRRNDTLSESAPKTHSDTPLQLPPLAGTWSASSLCKAPKEFAAVSTNRQFVPTTDPQAEVADLTERRMPIDERETRISTTERNLGAREARLPIREENVFEREDALLERETTLMERERAFVLRNQAEL
ncbi:hypothetical protein EPUS_04711 [Endocarpon pusillum Z07020]|uniref:Uncharacterized protein n=1 Tax=Endocarpon pusillum (strain Z07020 / HMAS-L-300199) TaxID=1263415 RepID=U1GEB8_ENDPU|nr:uncharacterized protein EPUS_04711 [Endocarpon pusillum Z07020]ERF70433.1 hypothetical protein EPUS_04711 [Endocarpon pusillum Z07020]